jgi:uncharacterized ferritin-like protein (DUF455 family)
MNNIFEFARLCLHNADIEQKLALTHRAWQLLENNALDFSDTLAVDSIDLTRFPQNPQLLAPRFMPKRKLSTPRGKIAFFHAIAHVEFMAIYLAWDILYRFRGLPQQFYKDWLRVADEEAHHFELLQAHLKTMNTSYGELPAHTGLWDNAQDTAHDLLARLALVPRCLEARGLDVTPALIEKFEQLGDSASVALLQRILTDEVGHVERGSYWFNVVCEQRGLNAESSYQSLIADYFRGQKPKGPFNREMRIIAGFTRAELDWLES